MIERKSDYLFVYNSEVDTSIRVPVDRSECDPLKLLDAALVGTGLGYQIECNYIALRIVPKPAVVVALPEYMPAPVETEPIEAPSYSPAENIEDVIVVAMGHQRKISVIGAISTVDIKDLNTPNRALSSSMVGRFPGIVGFQMDGEPGRDNYSFWIRGISTFGSNKTPLVLIDGVERYAAMDNLDIEEIESISILKDASATAVYGTRAANGVVMISTKRGSPGQKATVELKMEYGLSRLSQLPELLGGADYMTLSNEILGRQEYSAGEIEMTRRGSDPILWPDVDWMNEVFKKNSNNHLVSATVSGGGETARYFVALGYMNERGNFRDNLRGDRSSNIDMKRYNLRSNLGISLTPDTDLDIELGLYSTGMRYPGSTAPNVMSAIMQDTPILNPVRYPVSSDNRSTEYVWAATPPEKSALNPVQRINDFISTRSRGELLGQVRLTHKFDRWVRGLSANVAVSLDASQFRIVNQEDYKPTYTATGRDERGELRLVQLTEGVAHQMFRQNMLNERTVELKTQINYDRIFVGSHRFGAMAIYYQRDYRRAAVSDDKTAAMPYRKQGVAFRTTYSWRDRYFAEVNLGYNGSENFRAGERFGFFPAGAIGWMVSNEKWWRDAAISRLIPSLKLRASVGLVGSEMLPVGNRFAYLTSIQGYGIFYEFGPDGTILPGVEENQHGVQNLTWEKGQKSNFGIDIHLPRNIASLQVDLFHEKRSDILVQRTTTPDVVGVTNAPMANLGQMVNRGVDGSLDINHHIGPLRYRLYANVTFCVNKIVEMDEVNPLYGKLRKTGRSLNSFSGYVALGYFTDQQDVENSPKQTFGYYGPGDIKYLDVNGDNVVDSDDFVDVGYAPDPQLTYGFGVQLSYRGFDLAMFFRGRERVSNRIDVSPFVTGKNGKNEAMLKQILDRWTSENPRQDAFYPNLSNRGWANNFGVSSSKWIVDAGFLRLADLEVGYNFPRRRLASAGLGGLRIYFHGTNLALFSKFKLWDPEIRRSDGTAYPPQKKYNLGLRFNF
jgi:TonB-linked SusC/RagA family outer membrane protein